MKKTVRRAAAAAAMVLVLGGCGASSAKEKKISQAEDSAQTERADTEKQPAPAGEQPDSQPEPAKETPAASQEADLQPAAQSAPEGAIRPEFKEAVDAYVAFYDEYAAFMQKYMADPSDLSLLMEMTDWIERVDQMNEKLEVFEDNEESWSAEEIKYWTSAYLHISEVLLSAAS